MPVFEDQSKFGCLGFLFHDWNSPQRWFLRLYHSGPFKGPVVRPFCTAGSAEFLMPRGSSPCNLQKRAWGPEPPIILTTRTPYMHGGSKLVGPLFGLTQRRAQKPCPKRVLPPYPHLSANRPDLTFGFPLWVHVVSWPPKAITFYFWVHAMQVRFGTYGRVFFEGASFFLVVCILFFNGNPRQRSLWNFGLPEKRRTVHPELIQLKHIFSAGQAAGED